MAFNWTPNRVHKLQRLIAESLSASQVAERMGCTRGAALGKAAAIGERFNSGRVNQHETPAERAPALEQTARHPARSMRRYWRGPSLSVIPLPVSELRAIDTPAEHKPMICAQDHECRWPMSPPLEPGHAHTPYCCAHVAPGESYCADHLRLRFFCAA